LCATKKTKTKTSTSRRLKHERGVFRGFLSFNQQKVIIQENCAGTGPCRLLFRGGFSSFNQQKGIKKSDRLKKEPTALARDPALCEELAPLKIQSGLPYQTEGKVIAERALCCLLTELVYTFLPVVGLCTLNQVDP
jgi:hypothetical protein